MATEGDSAASQRRRIFVLSDSTAETADRVLRAALIQFHGVDAEVRIFSMVRRDEEIDATVRLAAEAEALLVYTLVNPEQRQRLAEQALEHAVPTVDIIGQLMTRLTSFFGAVPVGRPGHGRLTDEYFRRIEAVEFSVQHDDGKGPSGLREADIVLVGLSRTSKTPLSTYLAQKGWKVANVPVVLGLPLPRDLDSIQQTRVFGLTIDVASLMRIRRARLKSLNMPVDTDYARRDHILRELEYARSIFEAHPTWPVIDVSQKAIEETASIVLRMMEERRRKGLI